MQFNSAIPFSGDPARAFELGVAGSNSLRKNAIVAFFNPRQARSKLLAARKITTLRRDFVIASLRLRSPLTF